MNGPRPAARLLLFRSLLAAALVAIAWIALTPAPPVGVAVSDKLQHVLAFAALALLADLSWPGEGYWLPKALPLLAYGGLIELAQATTVARSAEWLDLVADGAGLAAYPLLAAGLRTMPGLRGLWAR